MKPLSGVNYMNPQLKAKYPDITFASRKEDLRQVFD